MAEAKNEAAKAADDKPQTTKVTVAKGRSLYVGGKHHLGDAEVEVATDEVPGLMEAGFLVNPDAPIPTIDEGPKVTKKAS